MTIKSKIRVTVDITDANGKIRQFKSDLTQAGMAGEKAGQQVQRGMNQASQGINAASKSATAASVNFQTMGMGMLNLSTAGVQTFTSFSNLDRVQNRAAASAVGLQRAQDLLARKTEQLRKLQEAGNGAGRDAVLITKEIATATADLAVKEDKLKIEKAAVTDVYMLFAANLMNVGVSSLMIYKTMMDGTTISTVANKISTIANTGALKVRNLELKLSNYSLLSNAAMHRINTAAMNIGIKTTYSAVVATKALQLALGPVGWIILGISTALQAYETNFWGFKDGINGFLGIQEDFNEGLGESKEGMDELGESTSNMRGKFDKLPETWTQARTALNKYRNDLIQAKNDQDLMSDSTERLNSNIAISLSGFNGASGPKTEQQKNGLFGILERISKLQLVGNQAYAQVPEPKTSLEVQKEFDLIPIANIIRTSYGIPIVTGISNEETATLFEDARMRVEVGAYRGNDKYNGLNGTDSTIYPKYSDEWYKEKENKDRIKKLAEFGVYSMIGSNIVYGGTPVDEFDTFRGGEFLISNKEDKKFSEILGKRISIYEANNIYKRAQAGDKTLTDKERDVAKAFSIDLGIVGKDSKSESSRLMKLDNREFIKQALFVDIGAVANVIPRTEALRLAVMQKTMTKQFTNTTGGRSAGVARTLAENGGMSPGLMNWINNLPTRQSQDKAYNIALGNGSISATDAYQVKRVYNEKTGVWDSPIRASAAFYAANAQADYMANSGLGNRIKSAGNIFGAGSQGYQQLGMGYRSNIPAPRHYETYAPSQASAREFGADEIANQEMAEALNAYNADVARGRPGGIQPIIARYYEATQAIAARSNARASASISSMGINFNPNDNSGYWDRYSPRSNTVWWVSTSVSNAEQIRRDIMASVGISIPSASRLRAISQSFAVNGQFSNFDNTAITQEAMGTLGMTEQAVFDLRFNETRGDRELENRMRHIEQQAASSSGTSPL